MIIGKNYKNNYEKKASKESAIIDYYCVQE